ncbi:DUF2304 domain-containing protein [archaeon]|mgnify:CR=1 FL=1|jgi:hypothetical protein|nr:DUF2304 domain-containing protein [archaeon]MBT6761806.1 DUF2304 domain-containing protein [archaeon]
MEIILQSIGFGFALFMLYITFTQFKRGDLTSKDLALWGIAWVVLGIFILFPQVIDSFAGSLSVQGAMQFIILISIGFLFIVSFIVYQKMRKQEMKINKLISAVTIEKTPEPMEGKKEE